jgi:hypothetical protein
LTASGKGHHHGENTAGGLRKIEISKNKLELVCHLNQITMGELGQIGYYLRLELA